MHDETTGRKPTVFFVDDDDGVRRTTAKILTRNGYEVLEAATAEAATELIEAHHEPIDVLLMDINLPDGWGAILAQRLLVQHPEMKVVYTTGFASSDPILSGGLNDAQHVLQKPFNSKQLLGMIHHAMTDDTPHT